MMLPHNAATPQSKRASRVEYRLRRLRYNACLLKMLQAYCGEQGCDLASGFLKPPHAASQQPPQPAQESHDLEARAPRRDPQAWEGTNTGDPETGKCLVPIPSQLRLRKRGHSALILREKALLRASLCKAPKRLAQLHKGRTAQLPQLLLGSTSPPLQRCRPHGHSLAWDREGQIPLQTQSQRPPSASESGETAYGSASYSGHTRPAEGSGSERGSPWGPRGLPGCLLELRCEQHRGEHSAGRPRIQNTRNNAPGT